MIPTRMNGKPDTIFEPDVLLPGQYLSRRGGAVLGGERRLMLAVLEDAVLCFQTPVDIRDWRARQRRDEAREYLWSDDRTWLFSVANVCDTLDIDVGYLRRGLTALLERQKQIARTRSDAMRPIGGISEADVSGRKGGAPSSPLYGLHVAGSGGG